MLLPVCDCVIFKKHVDDFSVGYEDDDDDADEDEDDDDDDDRKAIGWEYLLSSSTKYVLVPP